MAITIQYVRDKWRCEWRDEQGRYYSASFDDQVKAIGNASYFVKYRGYTLVYRYYPAYI